MHVIDISETIDKMVSPSWLITQPSEHHGRDLRPLENEVAASLGVKWPVAFGEEMQGVYEDESLCAQVAKGMMRRRPDLQLWVTCSDPDWRPKYSPLAHIEACVEPKFE